MLLAAQVDAHAQLLALPRGGPELLVPSRLALAAPMSVIVFSGRDQTIIEQLGQPPGGVVVTREQFPAYDDQAAVAAATYARIASHIAGSDEATLDFDRVRQGRC